MKRKKKSRARRSKDSDEAELVEIQHSGCSITNLPSHVLVHILLKLPIKDIIVCKITCKSWYATISNPEFANIHYAQSQICPIVRTTYFASMSRMLYLLELEKDKRFMDRFSCHECNGISEPSCACQVKINLDYRFKLPLRYLQLISKDTVNCSGGDDSEFVYEHHKIVNSCNGFLCLSEPSNNNPAVVCNPLTGEFIYLPQLTKGEKYGFKYYVDCGFGFSPKNNQYKVVRIRKQAQPSKNHLIIEDRVADTIESFIGLAQVHTIGQESWKDIGGAPYWGYTLTFPTYLNGSLHWLCFNGKKLILIVSFDCENEIFEPFSTPPWLDYGRPEIIIDKEDYVGMGVLEGCLCICDSTNSRLPCVWVMKDYGAQKSWTKLFEVDMGYCDRILRGLYQPVKYMNNGALLMFVYPNNCLLYYDPRKPELKRFVFRGIKSKAEVISHTPSFKSLKDVISGCNVEVLNANSRCADLKLEGESRTISLYEKTKLVAEFESDGEIDIQYREFLRLYYGWEQYWWGRFW